MIVSLYTTNSITHRTVKVETFTELQNLVGGDIQVATQSSSNTVLYSEGGIPNAFFTSLVGDVVVAPNGWQDLPK